MKASQRGFTLVEMLIGLVLLGIVTTTIYRILTVNQRLARAQTEQVSLQSAVRTGSLVVATELKEIGINSLGASDIVAMSTNGITYRAMRSTGLACQVSATQVRIRQDRFYSTRNIVAGQDGLLLWVEGDPDLLSDDSWLILPITNVSNGSCGGGVPAIMLTTSINTAVTPLASILTEAPVRTFEVMELGITNVGGQNWLGARSVSGGGTMQPALGPITANGLELQYRDASNNVTTNPAAVQSIQIVIRGETDRMVRAGQGPLQLAQDSLSMRITLRNAPHP